MDYAVSKLVLHRWDVVFEALVIASVETSVKLCRFMTAFICVCRMAWVGIYF